MADQYISTHSGQEIDEAVEAVKNKVQQTTNAEKIYGTDATGNQTTYDKDDLGGGNVDDVKVDGTSVVTDKVANIDLSGKVSKTDIVDNLDSTDATKVLSAKQGGHLVDYVDASITDTLLYVDQQDNSEKLARQAGDDLRYTKTEADAKFSLISETGNRIDLECDTTTYKLTAKLYDKDDNLISTSTVIDLPIESLVMSIEYVDTTDHPKSIKITLQNGTVTYVPVGAIVSGLASQADLDAHTGDTSNPHGVTKSQVGLGNVPNVATNDQTPTYTEATTLSTLTSGEKISVAFGKIKKAITDLVSHLADNVRHITAAERTAWNAKQDEYVEITLSGSSGTLTTEQLNQIKNHPFSTLIVYSTYRYYCVYSSSSTAYYERVISTTSTYISITISSGAWTYNNYPLQTTANLETSISTSSSKYPSSGAVNTALGKKLDVPVLISSPTSLDNIITKTGLSGSYKIGHYYLSGVGTGILPNNYSEGWLSVYYYSSSYIHLVFQRYNGEEFWTNNYYSSAWHGWLVTPKQSDIDDAIPIGYYECTTASGTAAKVGTWVSGAKYTSSNLKKGAMAIVKFTNSNSASSPTLNLNSSGAKTMTQYGTSTIGTSSATTGWQSGAMCLFTYDGTYWVRNQGYNTNTTYTIYYTTAYCSTAAGTAAKTASCSGYVLTANRYVVVTFTTANSYAGALTLNINSTGAKNIYINGSASSSSNYTLPAGMYIAYYDGTNYRIDTNGRLPYLANNTNSSWGISCNSSDQRLYINQATSSEISAKSNQYKPITPNNLQYVQQYIPMNLQFQTTAPTSANSYGLKGVYLTSEPSTKYAGYLYFIKE